MKKPTSKPSAADSTVNLFSGRTKVDEEAPSIIEQEEVAHGKSSESILEAADRWRASAFWCAENLSQSFPDALAGKFEGQSYRLTQKDGNMFLEKFGLKKGEAYSWVGIMFPADDLYELARTFVDAAKARKAKETG